MLLMDMKPDEPKSLIERKVKKATPRTASTDPMPSTPAPRQAATEADRGAADIAGVLNAIDEDAEGGEEAAVPTEFDYQTDGEGGTD